MREPSWARWCNIARRVCVSVSPPSSVPSERSIASFPTNRHQTQSSTPQTSHSLHSSRHTVVIQHPRTPTILAGRSERLSHQHTFRIYDAPPVCRTFISRHPEATQMSLGGLRILAQTRPEAPKFADQFYQRTSIELWWRALRVWIRFGVDFSVPFLAQVARGIRGPTTVSRPRT